MKELFKNIIACLTGNFDDYFAQGKIAFITGKSVCDHPYALDSERGKWFELGWHTAKIDQIVSDTQIKIRIV